MPFHHQTQDLLEELNHPGWNLFNTAKDAAWVANVYNTAQNKLDLSNERGLVGYWKFDEGSGTTVTDYSGNGNHGTFAAISGDTTAYPTWEKVKF